MIHTIPYTTIVLCCILLSFELIVNIIYKNRTVIKKKFCNLDNTQITIYNFYKIYTSLLIHNNILTHFIPNIIITAVMGSILENLIGTHKMFVYLIICIFIFWTFVYILCIKPKTGCGSSAIFYYFFSFYFTIIASRERDGLKRLFNILAPVIILIVFHILGRIVSASTEFIHILSLMYGYIIGLYYNMGIKYDDSI